MKKAGTLMGKSDSYIAHLETGRMDLPSGEKLDRLLMAYGGIKQESFFEKVRNFQARPNDKTLFFSDDRSGLRAAIAKDQKIYRVPAGWVI